MENFCNKTCRTCNKENFFFCDVYHEVIQKILKYVPNLLNVNDENLLHITKICTSCYQMIKTIIYQIESVIDIQKILTIENPSHLSPLPIAVKKESEKRVLLPEDIAKKYTNIKVRKVSLSSIAATPSRNESGDEKLVVIEALPDEEEEEEQPKVTKSPPKIQRALMCIACSSKFYDFSKLQAHLKSCKVSTSNQLKCFCGKILRTKKELAVHVYNEHKQNKRKHMCTVCKKVFTSLFSLQNHMVNHKGSAAESKGTFFCQNCDQKFAELELLKKHRATCIKKMIEA